MLNFENILELNTQSFENVTKVFRRHETEQIQTRRQLMNFEEQKMNKMLALAPLDDKEYA
jgi:hypothetical protein